MEKKRQALKQKKIWGKAELIDELKDQERIVFIKSHFGLFTTNNFKFEPLDHFVQHIL